MLPSLVEKHGVELRAFPEAINDAIGRTAMDVLNELGDSDELTRRIHGSYMAFLRAADAYVQRFDAPILEMRARALAGA